MSDLYVSDATKQQLLALPRRDASQNYDSVIVLQTGETHESGWNNVVVIGCIENQAVEIACDPTDSVSWEINKITFEAFPTLPSIYSDIPASGGMHFWLPSLLKRQFRVGHHVNVVCIFVGEAE